MVVQWRGQPQPAALLGLYRPHQAFGGHHQGPLHRRGGALLIQKRHQGLAHRQLADRRLHIKGRVGAEGGGCRLHGLLLLGGEGPQGVLHAIAQLAQHLRRQVEGVLGAEVEAHPLGADQPHHLLHLLQQHLWGAIEEQVGLIEDHQQLRFLRVAHLGQLLIELGEQPEHHRGVELGGEHQLVGRQDVHNSMAGGIGLEQVQHVERGLAEEAIGPLLFQGQQRPLDRPHAGGRDVAVGGLVGAGVLAEVAQQLLQILEIKQQQALVVGETEGDREHPGLGVVEVEQAGQQDRPQLGDRGPQRMALLAQHIPELHRAGGEGGRLQSQLFAPLAEHRLLLARGG